MKIFLSYLTIYTVWGSTYFAIKLAVQTIPPFTVVGLRFLFGGLLLAGIVFLQKRITNLSFRQVLSSVIVGCFLLIGGNGLITVAQKQVDSYLAALLVASCPIAVMIFDRIILGKRIVFVNLMGVAIGITGIGLLLYKGGAPKISPQIALVVLGTVLWALGTSLSKKLQMPHDSLVNAAIQLSAAGLIAMLCIDPFVNVNAVNQMSWTLSSIISLSYLAIFGSIALAAYAYLLKHEPNHRVVSYVFVNPPLALLLGLAFGKETAVPLLVPSMGFLLCGLGLIFYGEWLLDFIGASFRKIATKSDNQL